jgi:integrase
MGTRLTDKVVDNLPLPAKGNVVRYDAPNGKKAGWIAGFGVRLTAGGSRTFIFNYRNQEGRDRRYTIGARPAWSTEAARKEAADLKYRVGQGEDPQAEKEAERNAETMAELCSRFIEEHVSQRRPKTQDEYKSIVAEIVRAIGTRKVIGVTFADVGRLHREISKRAPYRANRTLAILSKMFSLAVRWHLRPDNPCQGVERNAEYARERYIEPDELARLHVALDRHRDQEVANLLRFLLWTGARAGEAENAEWPQFDSRFSRWTKPAHTTKQKKLHLVPLSEPVRKLLAHISELQPVTTNRVFPNIGDHRRVLRHWTEILAAAKIRNLRVHDLRHSFASALANQKIPLQTVSKLLGHAKIATTERYAHLYDDTLGEAAEVAGAALSGKLKLVHGRG